MLELVIGNKNYSSWSMRPWIAFAHFEIPFEEIQLNLDFDNGNQHLFDYSPTGKVPALRHNGTTIWDSLAILEYAAECFPEKGWWPENRMQRALARSVASEMHSGFFPLRAECPMNMRRPPKAIEVSDKVHSDVARIEALWRQCLETSGGPFLFGDFGIADAMYAPVVNRFDIYMLTRDDTALAYMARMKELPAWQNWQQGAEQEEWVIELSER